MSTLWSPRRQESKYPANWPVMVISAERGEKAPVSEVAFTVEEEEEEEELAVAG